jgi:hypothetical protein
LFQKNPVLPTNINESGGPHGWFRYLLIDVRALSNKEKQPDQDSGSLHPISPEGTGFDSLDFITICFRPQYMVLNFVVFTRNTTIYGGND